MLPIFVCCADEYLPVVLTCFAALICMIQLFPGGVRVRDVPVAITVCCAMISVMKIMSNSDYCVELMRASECWVAAMSTAIFMTAVVYCGNITKAANVQG